MKDTVKYGLVTAIIYIACFTLLISVNALVNAKSILKYWVILYTDTFPLTILLLTSAVAFYVGYRERQKYLTAFKREYITKESSEYPHFKRRYLRQDCIPRMILKWGVNLVGCSYFFLFGSISSTKGFGLFLVWYVGVGIALGLIARKIKTT